MARTPLWTFVACGLLTAAAAPLVAQQPGDHVAATAPIELRVEQDVVERVGPGSLLQVRAVEEDRLLLAHEQVGWAARSQVVPVAEGYAALNQRIETHSQDAHAYLARAQFWLDRYRQDHRRGLDDLDRSLQSDSPDLQTLVDLAGKQRRAGRIEDAIATLSKALKMAPRRHDLLQQRGRLLLESEQLERAREDFDRVVELRPWHAEGYLGRARVLSGLDLLYDALDDLNKAARLAPRNVEIPLALGDVWSAHNVAPRAIQAYREALEMDPEQVEAHVRLGDVLAGSGQREQAIDHYTAALRLDPQRTDVYLQRSAVYFESGQYDNAIADCSRVIQFDPAAAEAFRRRGTINFERRNYSQAISDFRIALKLQPSLADEGLRHYAVAYSQRAEDLIARGDFDQAIADIRQAMKIDPDRAEALRRPYAKAFNQRALSWVHHRSHQRALEDADEAIRIDPQFAPAFYTKGYVFYLGGYYKEAAQHYERTVLLDPIHVPAFVNLAWLLATCPQEELRDGDRAVRLAEFAASLTEYEDPEVLDTLAAAHAEAGNMIAAVQWQTRAFFLASDREKADYYWRLVTYREGKPHRTEPPDEDEVTLGDVGGLARLDLVPKRPAPLTEDRPIGGDDATGVGSRIERLLRGFARDDRRGREAVAVSRSEQEESEETETAAVLEDDPQAVEAMKRYEAELGYNDSGHVISVNLRYKQFDDKGMEHLAGLPNLEVLNLTFTQITDEGLAHLRNSRRMTALSLDQTSITDQGLKHLAGMKNMSVLNLNAVPITDQSIETLAQMTKLTILVLTNTQLTPEGVQRLQKRLPDTNITY